MDELCGGLEMNGGFRKSAFCIATSTLENAMATFTVEIALLLQEIGVLQCLAVLYLVYRAVILA